MDLCRATIAVTGATGFLGRYLVGALRGRGARVIGVVRNPDRVPALAGEIEVRRADLADRASLVEGFRNVDVVVSNAALLTLRPQSWRTYLDANVEGTRNVYHAMAASGVERAVQISSVGVYRGHRPPVSEDHPVLDESTRGHRLNAYSLSKALSERTARSLAEERGIGITTLRPSGIYGAFDETFTAVHRRLIGTLPITVYPCWMRLCLVYAGDVAEAVALSLENPISLGRVYNVAGDDLTTWEFARAWGRAGGPSARLRIPLPVPYRRRYCSTLIRRELGWRCRDYEAAVRELLEREAGPGVPEPGT